MDRITEQTDRVQCKLHVPNINILIRPFYKVTEVNYVNIQSPVNTQCVLIVSMYDWPTFFIHSLQKGCIQTNNMSFTLTPIHSRISHALTNCQRIIGPNLGVWAILPIMCHELVCTVNGFRNQCGINSGDF